MEATWSTHGQRTWYVLENTTNLVFYNTFGKKDCRTFEHQEQINKNGLYFEHFAVYIFLLFVVSF